VRNSYVARGEKDYEAGELSVLAVKFAIHRISFQKLREDSRFVRGPRRRVSVGVSQAAYIIPNNL